MGPGGGRGASLLCDRRWRAGWGTQAAQIQPCGPLSRLGSCPSLPGTWPQSPSPHLIFSLPFIAHCLWISSHTGLLSPSSFPIPAGTASRSASSTAAPASWPGLWSSPSWASCPGSRACPSLRWPSQVGAAWDLEGRMGREQRVGWGSRKLDTRKLSALGGQCLAQSRTPKPGEEEGEANGWDNGRMSGKCAPQSGRWAQPAHAGRHTRAHVRAGGPP